MQKDTNNSNNSNNIKYIRTLHRILGISLGISIIAAGICLAVGCVHIYNLGNKPFSRETVAETFSSISIPVYICLFLTVAGFIADFIFSRTDNTAMFRFMPYRNMLKKMYELKDLDSLESKDIARISSMRKSRRIHGIIRTVLIFTASAGVLVYVLNPGNYDFSDINGSMIRAMRIMIPCMAAVIAYSVFTLYYNDKTMQTEFDILVSLPAAKNAATGGAPDSENPEGGSADAPNCAPDSKKPGSSAGTPAGAPKKKSPPVTIIRYALLVLGIAFIVYGIVSGGVADVLTKAANICTECIGLG